MVQGLFWIRWSRKQGAGARVVQVPPIPGGYRVGCDQKVDRGQNGKAGEAVADYYEVLRIIPKADPDMIHRVYRLLAQRYHPDNTATGDERHSGPSPTPIRY